MTTFLLIRHGETDAVGKSIMGWKPGWGLNQAGKDQVDRLARKLAPLPVAAVYSSPLERAVETANVIAAAHGLLAQTVEELGEVRVGLWEGMAIRDLEHREDFRQYNLFRGGIRPPGGELMIEVQARMLRQVEAIGRRHAEQTVAIVSHGDPLRSVVAHFLGIPADLMLRFEIHPASVSVLQIADWGARVLCVNETGEIPL